MAAVAVVLVPLAGAMLLRERGGGVPVTAEGVPFMVGGPWLRPDARYGPSMDAPDAGAVQVTALRTLLRLAEEHTDDADRVGARCVGQMVNYTIVPLSQEVLGTLRAGDRRLVDARDCRFRVETLEVYRAGLWPRRAWLLWTTVPEAPADNRAVLDIGFHAGGTHGAGWRCFLSRAGGRWAVDSTVARWQS
jgi:hypothetical protein